MGLGKCSETYIHTYYCLYYNKLNKDELNTLKSFLKNTCSNIDTLITEFNINGEISSILNIEDGNGFNVNVCDNDVIIKLDLFDNEDVEYLIMNYDSFESSYKIEL